jgi:(4-alkanoyl-5-oxo-2,5-dihydrofuran-3-yl)methyl phosphate reductase
MNYLITGATGDIGSRVVTRLLERGERPRVFVRDAQKARARYGDRVDISVGDLGDTASLQRALEGMHSLFLVNSGPELARRDEEAAYAARTAGVKHLVKLSSMDAQQQNVGTGVWHANGEAAIRKSGIPFTSVQPSGFMSNALFWAPLIKEKGIVRTCTGDGKIPFIHPEDIAAVATEALTTGKHQGQALPISGPVAWSYGEMAAKIGAASGRTVQFQAISEEEERQEMAGWGESAEMVEAHISIYRAIREGRLATVTDTVATVLGRKPFSFDQWAQENADAFR